MQTRGAVSRSRTERRDGHTCAHHFEFIPEVIQAQACTCAGANVNTAILTHREESGRGAELPKRQDPISVRAVPRPKLQKMVRR